MKPVAPENDFRAASANTAVIIENLRKVTEHKTGLIPAVDAARWGDSPGTWVWGSLATIATMRLGREQPMYEVAFNGKVYRMLARRLPGQDDIVFGRDARFELIRSVAPGMQCDGDLLEPPQFAPNTPRSLLNELMDVTGAELTDLMTNAYSIYHYRTGHDAKYPDSLTPKGYALGELLLLDLDVEGGFRSHYETPKSTNIELWTFFLNLLDSGRLQDKLLEYVNSRMAFKEFGEGGQAAMRAATKLRWGADTVKPNAMYRPFFEVFPYSESVSLGKTARKVGKNAYLM